MPIIAPGFVDLHVHGFGGHDAMGGARALDGMARALAAPRRDELPPDRRQRAALDAGRVRRHGPGAGCRRRPSTAPQPLGFNLEGPFLAEARTGAHDAGEPANAGDVRDHALDPLVDGLRVMTIAPELPGSIELIGGLRGRASRSRSVIRRRPSRRHAADTRPARPSTTHLFNAMTGLDHRAPGSRARGPARRRRRRRTDRRRPARRPRHSGRSSPA